MKRLTIIGVLVIIFGVLIYLIIVDKISGISSAIIIGLMIGSAIALRGQFRKQ